MSDKDISGDCVNLQNGEFGADQDVLSTDQCGRGTSLTASSFPTMDSVFDQRWKPNRALPGCKVEVTGGPSLPPKWVVEYTYKGRLETCAPAATVDWSGNIAVTSSDGRLSVSNTDIYGDLKDYGYDDIAIVAASSTPVQSISNADYFPFGRNPGNPTGKLPESQQGTGGVGLRPNTNLGALKTEINDWGSAIKGYAAEHVKDADIVNRNKKDGSKPFIIELLPKGALSAGGVDWSFVDSNGDGVIIIDIRCSSGSDWEINNSDVIIVGDSSVTAIFRIRAGSNMNLSNSAIMRCQGSPGILFAVGVDEGHQSGDAVMKGNNAVLNNVVFWELVNGSSDTGKNVINCQNCQGCSQFVADVVLHTSTSRFNKCTFGMGTVSCYVSLVIFCLGVEVAHSPFCYFESMALIGSFNHPCPNPTAHTLSNISSRT
jgi:hypothetical protein